MIREVNLLRNLPQYIQNFREVQEIMNIENPEIQNIENETEQVFNNQYISSCNSLGIKKFEEMLNIVPNSYDSLEIRKARVIEKWNEKKKYTYNFLNSELEKICGFGNFEVVVINEQYKLIIIVYEYSIEKNEQINELLNQIIPVNLEREILTLEKTNIYGINYTIGTIKSKMKIKVFG